MTLGRRFLRVQGWLYASSLPLSISMLFQLTPTAVLAASALSFALFLIAAVRFIGPITEYGSKRAYRLTASDHLRRRGSF